MLAGVNIANVEGAVVGGLFAVVATVAAWWLNHRTVKAAAREDAALQAATHDGSVDKSQAEQLWAAYGKLAEAQAAMLEEVREQLSDSDTRLAAALAKVDSLEDSRTGLIVQLEGMQRVAAELREEREALSDQVEQLQAANAELREERAALTAQVEQLNGRIDHLNALLQEHDIEAGHHLTGGDPS